MSSSNVGREPILGAGITAQLTVVGWLLLGGQFGFILFQMERVRSVGGSRFATAWSERIEVLSFLMLPTNLGALSAAAALAAIITFLTARPRSPWLDMLLRLTVGTAVAFVFVGFASIIEIGTRAGSLELDSIFLRLGGMSLSAGLALLCRLADVHRP